mmetsp:Transcript_26639/g.50049  ORF Transcript_26639/g.50049 Transcript_26639/m.50049 type:complete len:438 (+) Transcript_26639:2-1315(+)
MMASGGLALSDKTWKRHAEDVRGPHLAIPLFGAAMPAGFGPPGLSTALPADKTQELLLGTPGIISAVPCGTQNPLAPMLLGRERSCSSPKSPFMDVACVTKLARSPEGAEVVTKFLSANPLALPGLVSALLPEIPSLASHPYGAGVVSELFCQSQAFQHGLAVQTLSNCLQGSLLRLTKDRFGCRVIQAALREASVDFQSAFLSELKGQVLGLCQHLHANFVLQKCVELLEPRVGVFLAEELKDHAVTVAVHVYGCRVLQRLIEHCSREPQLIELVDSLLSNPDQIERLLKDLFGSNVLRALLVHGTVSHVKAILEVLSTNVLKFAKHKHASLVFERCLEVSSGSEQLSLPRKQLMAQLIQSNLSGKAPLSQVLLDRFGNYLAQRVIQCCYGSEEETIVELLTSAWPKLQRSPMGKHIMVAATRKFGRKIGAIATNP